MIGIWGFSLCSFISYAGSSQEANAWGSEEGSFNKSNSLPATEAPNRGRDSKKKDTGPHIGDRRVQLVEVKKRPDFNEGMFNAGKHLVKVYKVNLEFTALKKTAGNVELAAWLPIARGENRVNLNQINIDPQKLNEGVKIGYDPTQYGEHMILKTNAPFFIPARNNKLIERHKNEDYWGVQINKFNNQPNNYIALEEKNLGIKAPKDVKLEIIKGSSLQEEKQKMYEEIKASRLYWSADNFRLKRYGHDNAELSITWCTEYIKDGWDGILDIKKTGTVPHGYFLRERTEADYLKKFYNAKTGRIEEFMLLHILSQDHYECSINKLFRVIKY